jgi:hypothetical protein
VEVKILDGGYWDASASLFHSGAEAGLIRMYAWPFYIHHPKSGRHVVWDMGISSVSYSVKKKNWPRLIRIKGKITLHALGHYSLVRQISS